MSDDMFFILKEMIDGIEEGDAIIITKELKKIRIRETKHLSKEVQFDLKKEKGEVKK